MHNIFLDSVQCKVIGIQEENPREVSEYPPLLDENRIHVWSARYDDLEPHFRVLSSIVSMEEQKTAATFRKSANERKYLLRHGVLRIILGNYLNLDPKMVPFQTGKNGKPELDLQGDYAKVTFNVSHTSKMVLIGVTRKRNIGVDIVKMDPAYRFHDSAEYILTSDEKAFFLKIEPALRYQIFFRIWALKEAILKATGSTLTQMDKIDLSENIKDILFSPDCSMKYLNTHPPFFIVQFNSGSEHCGAIAVVTGHRQKSAIPRSS